jgi:ABC-type polysaccharide/polyol phosphate transport system ATPase subunit
LPSGSEVAVEVEDLSLWFRTTQEKKPTLKRRLQSVGRRRRSTLVVEALHEVNLEIPLGCVYGIIGPNGAGKSTLLRAIAGILPPSAGRIVVHRRVSILTLGRGFKRELTGRENVLLGGLAAGLDVEEIRDHMDEIIDFADIGPAIDYPVRTYSAGMGGRLGFAIASHLDPEILLIDEALSAGDAKFKGKCMERIGSLCEGDRTVMLVSHGLGIIKTLADQVAWLDHGVVFDEGPAEEVVEAYIEHEEIGDTEMPTEAAMEDF